MPAARINEYKIGGKGIHTPVDCTTSSSVAVSVDMCRHLHNIHSLWPGAEQLQPASHATTISASSLSSLSQLLASIYVSHAQKTRRPYHSWWCVIMTSEAQERKSKPTTYFLNQSALTNVGRKTTASVAVASHPSPSPVPACLPSSLHLQHASAVDDRPTRTPQSCPLLLLTLLLLLVNG